MQTHGQGESLEVDQRGVLALFPAVLYEENLSPIEPIHCSVHQHLEIVRGQRGECVIPFGRTRHRRLVPFFPSGRPALCPYPSHGDPR
mmetsp:Transcript_31505/g.62270  ORF Transcript_31505/g.62270 Transcript_31505/m.62270 type:complete len:88 (-) Transcript_31505:90-353(-)